MFRSFLISLVLILILDGIWLGFVMKDFNLRQLAGIGRIVDGKFQILYGPAVLSYLLMALSIAFFSGPRAVTAQSGLWAFGYGAFLGLMIYGIYDMTNLAILKDYPVPFAMADWAWGTFLYGLVTWAVGWMAPRILP